MLILDLNTVREVEVQEVDLRKSFGPLGWAFPLMINGLLKESLTKV
jgi:hypothetical protein